MRFVLGILVTLLALTPASAQRHHIFNRNRPDNYCPDCYTPNYSPRIPGVTPETEPAVDTELAEMEKIIPADCRVQNRGPNCGWCALEDVFVAAGYENFKGLRQRSNE